MDKRTQLGDALRSLRQDADVSIRHIGEKTGIDRSLLSKIENGLVKQPSQSTLNRLARYHNIEAEELYTLAGYHISTTLPTYAPYLRSRYDLPPQAIDELRQHFDYVKQKYNDDSTEQTDAAQ